MAADAGAAEQDSATNDEQWWAVHAPLLTRLPNVLRRLALDRSVAMSLAATEYTRSEHAAMQPDEVAEPLAEMAPRAVRGRKRTPGTTCRGGHCHRVEDLPEREYHAGVSLFASALSPGCMTYDLSAGRSGWTPCKPGTWNFLLSTHGLPIEAGASMPCLPRPRHADR